MYRCPCCGEPAITLAQKTYTCYLARSVTCRRCSGTVGISTTIVYLTNAPILLGLLGLYLYTLWGPQIRSRQTFWLLVISMLVVPMIYSVVATAMRVWLVPLVCRRSCGSTESRRAADAG